MAETNSKLNISFVLDETGSMYPLKEETIAGFNRYLRDIKKERKGKRTSFTLTLFNTQKMEVRHDAVQLKDVKKLDKGSYVPDACTPLYDAVGETIRSLEASIGKKGKAIVVIFTDGEENSSKDWTLESIRKLIEEKQGKGWAFVYLGSNQDAWQVGGRMGVNASNISSYDPTLTGEALGVAAGATVNYARSGGGMTSGLVSKEDIESLGN